MLAVRSRDDRSTSSWLGRTAAQRRQRIRFLDGVWFDQRRKRVRMWNDARPHVDLLQQIAAVLHRVTEFVDVRVARDDVRCQEQEELVRRFILRHPAKQEGTE